jgi:hypothetical protein
MIALALRFERIKVDKSAAKRDSFDRIVVDRIVMTTISPSNHTSSRRNSLGNK